MASSIAQIRKSVLTLALPVTISTLLQRTEGIAAVFLVGGLGATSIAAVGLGQLLALKGTSVSAIWPPLPSYGALAAPKTSEKPPRIYSD